MSRNKKDGTSFRISFARNASLPLILGVLSPVYVVSFLQMGAPMFFVVIAGVIAAGNFLRMAGLAYSFLSINPRAAYDFTQSRVALMRDGRVVKELSFEDGVKIDKHEDFFRPVVFFSRIEIPKGARVREWADRPEVIAVPYHPWNQMIHYYYKQAKRI